MNSRIITVFIVVAVLAVAGGIIFFKNFQGATIQDPNLESAAKWIGSHAVVYVQAGCSHCKDQEDLFGDNWKYINSIDCISSSENQQICTNVGIEYTPTWVINGQKYVGVQTIDELKKLTGYKS
jgi:glutaredoxin